MAWYRCGGGGIPSSLKGDMNDVFNKKFGTFLQDYPPEDWPGTVNLMGPLPEKTVSGSVVAFSDGADDVPLKSCAVTIVPTLVGVSSVAVVHGGKNLLDTSILKNGNFQTISQQSSHNVVTDGFIPIKGGAGYVYSCLTATSGLYFRFFDSTQTEITDSAVNAYNATSKTFTTPPNAVYYRVMWYHSSSEISVQDIIDRNVMVEVGSTPSTYATYVSHTTHTAALGRTIYGGSADIVNGTGTDENGNDFTFTPVPIISRLGDNTMWGDGDLSVTYRRDIDLALAQ